MPSTQGGVRYHIKVCAHDDEIEWKCYQKIRATTRRDVIARVCCNKRTGRKSVCYYPYTVATVELRTHSPGYSSKWEVSGRGKVPVSHKELQKKTKNLGGKLKFYYLEFLYPSFLTTRIQLRMVFLNFLRRVPLICVPCISQNVFTLLGHSLHHPVVIYEFPYGHLHPLLRCDSP